MGRMERSPQLVPLGTSSLSHLPHTSPPPSKPHLLRESQNRGKAPKSPGPHSWLLLQFPPLKLPGGHRLSLRWTRHHPFACNLQSLPAFDRGCNSSGPHLWAREPAWELHCSDIPVAILFQFGSIWLTVSVEKLITGMQGGRKPNTLSPAK